MRAMTVHELRGMVSARHKDRVMRLPIDEATKFVSEHYGCDEDSARAYVSYLKGERAAKGEAEEVDAEEVGALDLPGPKKTAMEVIHTRFDPLTGRWVLAQDQDDTQA